MDVNVINKLKLNKHSKMAVLNAPSEFMDVLKNYNGEVVTSIEGQLSFVQIFITSQQEAIEYAGIVTSAIIGDGVLWICYPKGTSKKYKNLSCNRDTLASLLVEQGFKANFIVSLDDDWSAIRFRKSEYVGK